MTGRLATFEEWLRAPWAHTFPLRFTVTRALTADRTAVLEPQVWAAIPQYRPEDRASYCVPVPGTGNREIEMPELTALAATWREAMDYALGRGDPRPLEQIYPEWCAVLPDRSWDQ